MEINGSSAIVTGGASGIGAAVVRRLAGQGVKVVIADMNADKGEALAKEVGGEFVAVDVTKTEQNQAAVVAVREALEGSTDLTRAELVEEIMRQVYDWTKFREPGGEGLDGRDGPERRSLGGVLTEAIRHHDQQRMARAS